MLCAIITLLRGILEEPADLDAQSDTNLICSFVQFLENVQRDEGCDLAPFTSGCTLLQAIAQAAVGKLYEVLAESKASHPTAEAWPPWRLITSELLQVG